MRRLSICPMERKIPRCTNILEDDQRSVDTSDGVVLDPRRHRVRRSHGDDDRAKLTSGRGSRFSASIGTRDKYLGVESMARQVSDLGRGAVVIYLAVLLSERSYFRGATGQLWGSFVVRELGPAATKR